VSKGYKSILIISDLHYPFNHPDVIAFLRAIKAKFKPDKVVSLGDEIDGNSISFHDREPDLMSPREELETAISRLQPLYKLFPEVDLVESNHGSLVYRRGKYAGLPRHVLKGYREVIQAPKGWKWHSDLKLKMSDGNKVYICHGRSANGLKLSQSMGMSTCQGHYHSTFEAQYWGNSEGLYWSVIAGCLIDNDSLAFSYNKLQLKRPVIGCVVILDGHPKLLPMVLDSDGRWIKKLV
jgi:hypothetical protein